MKKQIIIFIALVLVNLAMPVFAKDVNVTEDASNAIQEAETIIKDVTEAGFGTTFFNDAFSDANEAFAKGKYDLVLDKAQEIINRKERAFKINDSISVLEIKVKELKEKGLETAKATELLELSKSVFKKEAFDDAEALISRTDKEFDEIESQYTTVSVIITAARNNIAGYIRENWIFIIIAAAVLSVSGILAYIHIDMKLTRQKLEDLELRKSILENLMKKAESSYYKEQVIGKREYEITMQDYQDEITDIKGKMPVFRDKLKVGKTSYIKSNLKNFYKIITIPKLLADKLGKKIKANKPPWHKATKSKK